MQNLECVFEINQRTHSVDNYLLGLDLAFCTQTTRILRKLNRFEQRFFESLSLYINLCYIICQRLRNKKYARSTKICTQMNKEFLTDKNTEQFKLDSTNTLRRHVKKNVN